MSRNTDSQARTPAHKAEGILALTAVCWSTGGLFIKLTNAPSLVIAGGRSFIAFLVMLAFNRKPRFTWSFAQIGAAISYALTMILYVAANKYTSSANAILLQYAAPAYVAFLAWAFLGEKPRVRDLMALGVVMGGMVLFFAEKIGGGQVLGNLLAIGSGIAFAFSVVFMRMQKDGSPSESFMIAHLLAFAVSLPFWGGLEWSWGNIAGILALGVIQIGFSSVTFAWAIRHVPALASILIVTLEPILNPVWVFVFTRELPSAAALAGGGLILFAVIALQLSDGLGKKNKAPLVEDLEKNQDSVPDPAESVQKP